MRVYVHLTNGHARKWWPALKIGRWGTGQFGGIILRLGRWRSVFIECVPTRFR